MSDLFREVDEALQKEKAAKFWKEYGPTLVLAAIVLIASTAITTAYQGWRTSQNHKETAKLVLAAEDKDIAAAMEKISTEVKNGHKTIALLNAAGKEAGKNNFSKAAALYTQVSTDSSAPADLRDLGTLLGTRADLLAAKDKTVDYKALAGKLLPIAQNPKSAFQLQAKLDAALLYGDGQKDYTKALELLKDGFGEAGVSDSLTEKASALKHVYEYEATKQ